MFWGSPIRGGEVHTRLAGGATPAPSAGRAHRNLDRVLDAAGAMLPVELRSLDASHLATAQQLGADPARIVTYDDRMAVAADQLGMTVARPS
jgi:predicted nucleic acid-binding protein